MVTRDKKYNEKVQEVKDITRSIKEDKMTLDEIRAKFEKGKIILKEIEK